MCCSSAEEVSLPGPMGRWSRRRTTRRWITWSLGLEHSGRSNDQEQNEQYTSKMRMTHLVFPSSKDFHPVPMCRSCATSAELCESWQGGHSSTLRFPIRLNVCAHRGRPRPATTRTRQTPCNGDQSWGTCMLLVCIAQTQQIYRRAVRTIAFHRRHQPVHRQLRKVRSSH